MPLPRAIYSPGRHIQQQDPECEEWTGYEHLKNSLAIFKAMEEKVKKYDYDYANKLIAEKKFEQLEMYTVGLIMGIN